MKKCLPTYGSVVVAGRIAKQCLITHGGVVDAGSVGE
jgi:hypothetical protein